MSSTDETSIDIPATPSQRPNVALIGKMGSGKSSVANVLCAEYDYVAEHFAKSLKDVATQIWGEGASMNRDYLQRLGVLVRSIDEAAWVNILLRRLDESPDKSFVVDDCRFPNEYEALAKRGFVFIEVETRESLRVDRLQRIGKLSDLEQLNHESEIALDDRDVFPVDYRVTNDGDDMALRQQVVEQVIYGMDRRV